MSLFDSLFGWLIPEQETPPPPGVEFSLTNPVEDPLIYGEVKRAEGVIVQSYVTNTDDDDIPNDLLFLQVIWSVGDIESIDQIYLDDEPIDSENFDGDDDLRWVYHWNYPQGGDVEIPLPSRNFETFSRGYAYSIIRLEYGSEGFTNLPVITADIKGRRIKNVTTGVTEYSNNYADVISDYLRSSVYGRSINPNRIHTDSFSTEREFMAELVERFEGDEELQPLMSCNIRLNCGDKLQSNIEKILKGCRGFLPYHDGQFVFKIEREREPLALEINDSNRLADLTFEDIEIKDHYNKVTVRYSDKEQDGKAATVVYPTTDAELLYYLQLDNSNPLEKTVTMDCVNNSYEALQAAEIIFKRSRDSLKGKTSVPSTFSSIVVGDVIPLSNVAFGVDKKPFLILNKKTRSTGVIEVELLEYQPSIYPWNKKPEQVIPDTTAPSYSTVFPPVNLTVTKITDGTGQALLTWESINNRFEILIDDDNKGVFNTKSYVLNNLKEGSHNVKIRAINGLGYSSSYAESTFLISVPAAPTVSVQVSYDSAVIIPTLDEDYLGVLYEYLVSETSDIADALPKGGSGNLTLTGLTPDTEYYVWVRSVSVSGASEWVNASFKTSNDNTGLIEFLDGSIGIGQLADDVTTQFNNFDRDIAELDSSIGDINIRLPAITNTMSDLSSEVFNVTADYSAHRDEYERRTLEGETLTNAVVYRDPDTGVIVNKAFSYSDEKYTEAGLLIDGVNAKVVINAESIVRVDERVESAESEITVMAGEIQARATYSEVDAAVAKGIDALTPAYSWQFNTGSDGWDDVNWDAQGFISFNQDNSPSITDISFDADENTSVQVRIKNDSAIDAKFSWNGGNQQIPMSTGSISNPNVWETKSRTMTAADGWTGEITSIQIHSNGDKELDIDYFVIGKPSANQAAVDDLTARMTTAEIDINANAETLTLKVSTQEWSDSIYTDSDVGLYLDNDEGYAALKATYTELDSEDTVNKANTAELWVSAAEENITSTITSYNTDNGVPNSGDLVTVQQRLDAAEGSITNSVVSISGIDERAAGTEEEQFWLANDQFLQANGLAKEGVKVAYAEQKIQAQSDESSAQATSILELTAITESSLASIKSSQKAIATLDSALTTSTTELTAEIGDSEARANEYTRTAIGVCYDADGNPTGEEDAITCVAVTGNSWVAGAALSESVRNVTVTTGKGTAKITDMAQVFTEDDDGNLIAVGGVVADVNGKVSGFTTKNDGSRSSAAFIQDDFIVGGYDSNGDFQPTLHVDTSTDEMTLYGRIVLPDGKVVEKEGDIRSLDSKSLVATADSYIFRFKSDGSLVGADDLTITVQPSNLSSAEFVWTSSELVIPENTTGTSLKVTSEMFADLTTAKVKITHADGVSDTVTITRLVDGKNPTVVRSGNSTTITDGDGGSVTIPDGEDAKIPTVSKTGDTVTIDDGYGNTVNVTDGSDPELGIDYFEGKSGDYISSRFKNVDDGSDVPTKPANGSGSFNGTAETAPDGDWDDNHTFVEGKTTYRIECRYKETITYSNGVSTKSWSSAVWSDPQIFNKKGDSPYQAILSNPTQEIPCYSDGTPFDNAFVGSGTEIRVYEGVTELVAGTGYTTTYEYDLSSIRIGSGSLDNSSGYAVYDDHKSFVDGFEVGKVVYRVDILDSDGGIVNSFNVTQTLSKKRQGYESKSLVATADSYIFRFKSDGSLVGAGDLTITVQPSNLSSAEFVWTSSELVIPENTTGTSLKVTSEMFADLITAKVKITHADGVSDTVTITRLVDGAKGDSPYQALMSNPTHEIPCFADGTPRTDAYVGSGTEIRVYRGTEELLYGLTNDWTSTAYGRDVRIGAGSIDGSSGYAIYDDHEELQKDVGTVDYVISVYDENGDTITTFTVTQTLTKSLQGDKGLSAYEVWLSAGNTGTMADYLNSIDGDDGNTWYSGTTDPANSLGVIGDFYLKSGRYVYEKTGSNAWTYVEDIKGETGSKGDVVTTVYQYSPSQSTGWHDAPMVTGDEFRREAVKTVKADGSSTQTTWSDATQIKGDLGLYPAPEGGSGFFMDNTKLGYAKDGLWKTYMDNTGAFFLVGTNEGLTWNPDADTLEVKGTVKSSVIESSAFKLDSMVVVNDSDNRGAVSIEEFVQNNDGQMQEKTLTLPEMYSPSHGSGYNYLRFGHYKQDVFIDVNATTRTQSSQMLKLEYSYRYHDSAGNPESWVNFSTITFDSEDSMDYGAIFQRLRFTTRSSNWSSVQFMVVGKGSNSGNDRGRPLFMTVTVKTANYNESTNADNSHTGKTVSYGDNNPPTIPEGGYIP